MHPPSNLSWGPDPLYRPGSIHDTNRITYRCFLPDLTRFATVCCVESDQNVPSYPSLRSWGGNSAPHKADFGKRAPLTPHLAQPKTIIRHNSFFARKIFAVQRLQSSRFRGLGLRPSGFDPTSRVKGSRFRIILARIQALMS